MRCRPVDEYGDMVPVRNRAEMMNGARAVGQAIQSRLRMIYGEWWEDESLGFRVPTFLMDGIKSGDVDMLVSYIVSYIMETKEVASLNSQNYSFNDRKLSVDVTVNTEDGEIAEGSVTMSELLAAISG